MATNPGVIILAKEQLRGTFMHHRLDIEDNIGEEMHIHYKNFRFDFTVRDFLELARTMDDSLRNLVSFKENGNNELEIYLKKTGNINIVGTEIIDLKSKNNPDIMDNTNIKDYQIWKDTDRGMNFFVIPRHEPWVDDNILNDKELVNKILDYSQSDNKIIEMFRIDDGVTISKYYDGWYPFLIKSSNNSYNQEEFNYRKNKHFEQFKNKSRADKFYQDVINEYKNFNIETGCYFSDVFPNNILVNEDYTDFRIIDIGCLKRGKMTEVPSFLKVITGEAANNLGFIDASLLSNNWNK
tara:strand:- start:8366 stop:9253 length:888 start_codon:yes stop_codon:yes gene_type:complete